MQRRRDAETQRREKRKLPEPGRRERSMKADVDAQYQRCRRRRQLKAMNACGVATLQCRFQLQHFLLIAQS
eukprot:scaffold7402_cov220-Pinguiococcus_pyrenoidosus.AAC.1